MTRRPILDNLLIMGAGQIVTWTLSTVYIVLMSQYMGPARLGEIALAGSIAAMLLLVVRLGMATLITRTVARTPEGAGRIVTAALLIRFLLALLMFPALSLYARLTGLSAEATQVTYLVLLTMIISSFSDVLGAAFIGWEQMTIGVASQILRSIYEIAIIAITVTMHQGVIFFVSASLPFELLLLGLYVCYFFDFGHFARRVSKRDLREVVVGSLPFWAGGIVLTIYTYIDSLMLGSLAGTQAVGIYAPATRLYTVGFFLPAIVGTATLPLLSRLGVDAGADFRAAGRRTLSLLLICAVPLTIGLATFARPLIAAIYGGAYGQSVPVLAVLSFSLFPTYLNMQASQTLAAINRQWRWTVALALSCVANPLLNLALIPFASNHWHNGALGAAFALLITEVGMALYSLVPLREMLLTAEMYLTVGCAVAGGVVQVAVLCFTSGLWLVAGEALGGVAYALVVIALGVLPWQDVLLLVGSARDLLLRRRHRAQRVLAGQRQRVAPAG